MRISHRWLWEYVSERGGPARPLPVEETAALLTGCGLEVEAIEKFESVKGGLAGVVVGKVLRKTAHPDADKLCVTEVDAGTDTPLQIVCGAPNVAEGQYVLVATVGTTLYLKDDKPLVIKKSKIRGEVSEGMICAEDELGLGTNHDGIMVLDGQPVTGTPAAEHLDITTDDILEIGLTPNRADATSHIGVARDLVAVLNNRKKEKVYTLNIPSVEAFTPGQNKMPVTVTIDDPEDCPRYAGLTVSGVTVGESPAWLRERLGAIGLTPINNVVDITNFVLFETGQPLHAFDYDRITDHRVVVHKLPGGTVFTTLDETERKLTGHELMICDGEKGMCMAGVFGGQHSGITAKSQNVFLESAIFNPTSIRRTAKHHNLHTDAGFRFERGVDPDMTLFALKRAAMLLHEICGGDPASGITDQYPRPAPRSTVRFHFDKATTLTGVDIGPGESKSILSDLGIEVTSENERFLDLAMPGYKNDMRYEADIAEEVLRIGGYDRIPLPHKMNMPMPTPADPSNAGPGRAITEFLVAHGFYEILTNSLVSEGGEGAIRLLNPVSADHGMMRQSMLPSGLEAIAYNCNRKRTALRFFQQGKTYSFRDGKTREHEFLSILVAGDRHTESWIRMAPEKFDVFYMKTLAVNLLVHAGVPEDQVRFTVTDDPELFDCLAVSAGNRELGRIGGVSQTLLSEHHIPVPVFIARVNIRTLPGLASRQRVITEAPRFPEVRRDLSMIIPQEVTYEAIESLAFATEKKLLRRVALFDIYKGDRIAGGQSYALRFTLRDDRKTLDDKEIDKTMGKLVTAFEKKLGAQVRS